MAFIKTRNTALIGLVLSALIWSTGGMLIKSVNGHPFAIAGGRAVIASIFLLFFTRFKLTKLNRSQWIMAVCYALTAIQFVLSTRMSTAANAIFLQFTATVWVVVFSRVFYQDKIRKSDILSILLILGCMTLFFIGKLDGGTILGNIFGLGSGITFAGFIVLASKQKDGTGLMPIIYGSILTGLVGIPFYSADMLEPLSFGALLILGVLQIGFAYVLYTKSMEYVTAIDGILIPVIEPILNPVWVMLTIGEKPTIYALIGGLCMLIIITIRSLYQSKKSDIPIVHT